MNERSETTAKDCAQQCALIMHEAVPPPSPMAMPTQVIEFWTPRLSSVALLHWFGRVLRRGSRGAAFSAADSHES
jgi:hypothetical protein